MVLILSFVVLVSAIGWVFGQLSGFGYPALAIAMLIAIAMTWTSYFASDKIALAMSRAVRADPLQHARLINIVEGLSIAAGITKPPRVYVVNDSAPNAFATGRNPDHAAIAVTTGLLEKMERVELEGVIAHEMAHIRNYDILVTSIAVTLAATLVLLSDFFLRGMRFGAVGGRRRSSGNGGGGNPIGLVLVVAGIVLAILSPLIAQLVKAAVSRKREALADATGVQLTRYPPGLIRALKKLQEDTTVVRTGSRATAHMWIESPLQRKFGATGWWNRLFDTHPPLEERIQALERI